MKADEVVNRLLETDADSVDPKDYLRTVEPPMLSMAVKALVVAAVEGSPLDPRDLISRGLQTIGVDPHKANLIALEQGSSQAYVNKAYLRAQGLTGRVLKDAAEFIKVAYDIDEDEDLLDFLYSKYRE